MVFLTLVNADSTEKDDSAYVMVENDLPYSQENDSDDDEELV